MAKKMVIFQFFKNCQFLNLHCFLGSILYLSLDNRKNCKAITIEKSKSEISVAMQKSCCHGENATII